MMAAGSSSGGNSSSGGAEDSKFCFRMSDHLQSLRESFSAMLQDQCLTDVLLTAEAVTLPAHKLILSASSDYFKSVFSAFTNPHTNCVVVLKDIAAVDLRAIVEFCYKG